MTDVARLGRLLDLLSDLDSDVDEVIDLCSGLSTSGDVSLVPPLETALNAALASGNFFARDMIADVLAGILGTTALPTLLRASAQDLGDDQDSLSAVLVDLIQSDPDASRAAVLPLIEEPNATLRATGVWAIGFAVGAQDLPVLARAATDDSDRVRAAAAGTLGSLAASVPDAVDLLIDLLADPHPQVRVSSLDALGWSRQPRALPAIRRLADDPDNRVRTWVTISTDRITGPEPGRS